MVGITQQRKSSAVAAGLLGLLATNLQSASGITSDIGCPTETVFCLGDTDCGSCLDAIEKAGVTIGSNFSSCDALYSEVCALVDGLGCDVNNSQLLDFAGCIAADEFGCGDLTTCAAAIENLSTEPGTTMPPDATMPPAVTRAPEATMAPTNATAEATALPSIITPAPTPSSRGVIVPDTTEAPTNSDGLPGDGAGGTSGVPRAITSASSAGSTAAALAVAAGVALALITV